MAGSITFYKLPSTMDDYSPNFKKESPMEVERRQGRGMRIPKWTLSGFDMTIIDFSMDPAQDLLVLIAGAPPGCVLSFLLSHRNCSRTNSDELDVLCGVGRNITIRSISVHSRPTNLIPLPYRQPSIANVTQDQNPPTCGLLSVSKSWINISPCSSKTSFTPVPLL